MSKLTKASKGEDCIRCGAPGAYSCHYNGTWQQMYGKGTGIKCSDIATAEFCHTCDQQLTEGVNIYRDQDERDLMFHHFVMLTNIRRFKNGALKT